MADATIGLRLHNHWPIVKDGDYIGRIVVDPNTGVYSMVCHKAFVPDVEPFLEEFRKGNLPE